MVLFSVDNMKKYATLLDFIKLRLNVDLAAIQMTPRLKPQFDTFLQRVYIGPNSSRVESYHIRPDFTFEQTVEYARTLLIKNRHLENLLIEDSVVNKDVRESYRGRLVKDDVDDRLSSCHWRVLHSHLGPHSMADILLNFTCFYIGNNREVSQLFGDAVLERRTFSCNYSNPNIFSLNSILYKFEKTPKDPLPDSSNRFLEELWGVEKTGVCTFTMKRMRSFLVKAIKNHKKIKYFQLLREFVEEPEGSKANIERSLAKSQISKFCIVVFDSVFPPAIYGFSHHNKSIIMRNIARFLNLKKGDNLTTHDIIKDLRMKSPRLTRTSVPSTRKTGLDYNHKQVEYSMFQKFIIWLFRYFLPRLVSSFFYATHTSATKEIIYFSRSTWKELTTDFGSSYSQKYLLKVSNRIEDSQPNFDGWMRFIPKKDNDFRVINVPWGGTTDEERRKSRYKNKYKYKSAQKIMHSIRFLQTPSFKSFPVLSSLNEIPAFLKSYKLRLKSEHDGHLPMVHFLQFDAKACYDNLSCAKVEMILRDMIDSEETYMLASSGVCNASTGKTTHSKTSSGRLTDTDLRSLYKSSTNYTYKQDKSDIITIEGRALLDKLLYQLHHSTVNHKGQIYERKEGVFQGLNFSAIFNDILYDKLIKESISKFIDDWSLILRIADDFLVLSLDYSTIVRLKDMITEGNKDFGFFINDSKTKISGDPAIPDNQKRGTIFCGYEINLEALEIIKIFPEEISYVNQTCHLQVIKQLETLLKMKLNYNTLDCNLNSSMTVLKQVNEISLFIAKVYVNLTENLELGSCSFERFLKFMIFNLDSKIRSYDENEVTNTIKVDEVESTVMKAFGKVLRIRHSKYHRLIDNINKQIMN